MKNKFSDLSVFKRAFLILALIFIVVGFGTLGSVQSVGKAYRLPKQRAGDGMAPAIMLYLSEPGHGEENHVHRDLYVKKIYVNAGTVYNEYGKSATLRLSYGVSSTSLFLSYCDYTVANMYYEGKEQGSDEVTKQPKNTMYNWGLVDMGSTDNFRLANYPYWKLTATNGDLLVNEVVFVANEKDNSGEDVLLNVTINTELTNLAEEETQVVKKAGAVIDRQKIPSLTESSYFKFTPEEIACLSTYTEARFGGVSLDQSVPHMDKIYSPLGLDILFLGPAIFGLSPFGFRFMPMLASVGILIFSYLFVKRLTGSDKAAFFFALLYVFCGMSFSLAHLGTPLMIGLFFFVAALYVCQGFFLNGMRRAKLSAATPVVLIALFSAAAVCTNGAFLIPVLGLSAYFAAGVVRQRKRLFAAISEEAENVIEEERETPEGEVPQKEGRKKVAKLVTEANYIRTVSVVLYCAVFVIGFLLLSIFALLPLYSTFVKVLDDPTNPSKSIFYFIFAAFAGGFSGDNGVAALSSPFNPVYVLFNGTGSVHALTAAGILPAVACIILGLVGLVVWLVNLCKKRESVAAFGYGALILLIGFVVALVTAFFAKGGLAFLLLAGLLLFAFAVLPLAEQNEENKSKKKSALLVAGVVLAAVCFVLFGALTFSVPLPESIVGLFV